jgi:hypothetical protein
MRASTPPVEKRIAGPHASRGSVLCRPQRSSIRRRRIARGLRGRKDPRAARHQGHGRSSRGPPRSNPQRRHGTGRGPPGIPSPPCFSSHGRRDTPPDRSSAPVPGSAGISRSLATASLERSDLAAVVHRAEPRSTLSVRQDRRRSHDSGGGFRLEFHPQEVHPGRRADRSSCRRARRTGTPRDSSRGHIDCTPDPQACPAVRTGPVPCGATATERCSTADDRNGGCHPRLTGREVPFGGRVGQGRSDTSSKSEGP